MTVGRLATIDDELAAKKMGPPSPAVADMPSAGADPLPALASVPAELLAAALESENARTIFILMEKLRVEFGGPNLQASFARQTQGDFAALRREIDGQRTHRQADRPGRAQEMPGAAKFHRLGHRRTKSGKN